MKAFAISSLGLVLAWTTQAAAQELTFRPAGSGAGSAAGLPRVAPLSEPAVSLSRPIPAGVFVEAASSPAAALDRPMPIFRAKAVDVEEIPQLMPVGPPVDSAKQPGTAKPMGNPEPSKTPAEPLKMPREPRFIAPAPSSSSSGWRTGAGLGAAIPGTVILHDSASAADSGSGCGSCCDTCCTDACGPCWGWRLRNWFGSWCNSCPSCAPCDDCGACGSCGSCWNMEGCCAPRPRCFVRGEYLLWTISNQHVPPLLTGENEPLRGPEEAGTLPLSPILFGEDQARDEIHNGARVQFGFWFTPSSMWGMDASAFMLGRRTVHAEAASNAAGFPVLARPFFQPAFDDVVAGEAAELISFPGLLAGQFSYDSATRLWGVDANFRRKLFCGPRWWLDGFFGYRFLQLSDTIDIRENILNLQFAPGDVLAFGVHDHFATRNTFNGGQIGLEGEVRLWRRWFLAGNFKVAVGNVTQTLNIQGQTAFITPGEPTLIGNGGLLALASNIGRHESNQFAVVPEFGIKLGFDITDHLRIYAGYNILCLTSALRAGDQIDRVVNFQGMAPTVDNLNPAVVAPARPAVLFRQSEFWAQGGQFGMEYHW